MSFRLPYFFACYHALAPSPLSPRRLQPHIRKRQLLLVAI